MRSRIPPLLPWAFLILLFLSPLLFGVFFSLRDFVPYFLPLKAFAVEETLAGRIPWWSPFNACGELFMTNPQVGLLYPPTWLFVLPPAVAGQGYQFLQLAAAALGMGLLARALGRSPAFAAALGFAYGFSGPLLSCWDLPFNLGAMAWLPWTLWGVKSARPAAGAVALALGFLAGEPVLWAAQLPLIALFAWVEGARPGPAVRGALLALPALAGTAAWLGLGYADSARRLAEETARAGLWGRDWAVCAAGPVLGLPFREPPAAPHDLYLPLPYLGTALLALALHGLAARGRHRWYLLPAVLFGLLAMGERGPLAATMGWPVLAGVRFPARFLLLVPPCLALLAVRSEGRRPALLGLHGAALLAAWAAGRFHPLLLVPLAVLAALTFVPWRSRGLAWVVLADLILVCAPLTFPQRATILETRPAVRPPFPERLFLPAESASFLRWVYPGGRFSAASDGRMLESGTAYANLFAGVATTTTPHPLKTRSTEGLPGAPPAELGAAFAPGLEGQTLRWDPVGSPRPVGPKPVEWTGRGLTFKGGEGNTGNPLRFRPSRYTAVRVDGRTALWTPAGPWIGLPAEAGKGERVEVDFTPGWAVRLYQGSTLCWAVLLCYAILEWKSRSRRSSA